MYSFKFTGTIWGAVWAAIISMGLLLFLLLGASSQGGALQSQTTQPQNLQPFNESTLPNKTWTAPPWTTGGIRPARSKRVEHADGLAGPDLSSVLSQRARLVDGVGLILTATVGLNRHQCAETPIIHVTAGTDVTYCYYVLNSGSEPLGIHTVDDSRLGNLIPAKPYPLAPGSAVLVTVTTPISETATNMGTWSVFDESGNLRVAATDTAKVYVDELVVFPGIRVDDESCEPVQHLAARIDSIANECHTLINNTDLILTRHRLSDIHSDQLIGEFLYEFTPGQQVTYLDLGISVTTVVTASMQKTIRWQATFEQLPADLGGTHLSTPSSISAHIGIPRLAFSYTVGTDRGLCAESDSVSVFSGAEIVLCHFMTNTGGITLTHHKVSDDILEPERIIFDSTPYVVPPGQSILVTTTQEAITTTTVTGHWIGFTGDPSSNRASVVSVEASNQVSITVRALAKVELIIFNDTNKNEERDSDEGGIPNALVKLMKESEVLSQLRTNADGLALFPDLLPGAYEVVVRFDDFPYFEPVGQDPLPRIVTRSGETTTVAISVVPSQSLTPHLYLPLAR
ncbi:MAG: SdrD B-like domain-containing protein [Chloroflexota bacterium]